jgi:phenylpropionate dioxygenase-like ring-hydroxylating dioxygenase large terminal subunit
MQSKSFIPPENWDRKGLPGWAYSNKDLFQLEMQQLFSTHWQLACHISDIPSIGSYVTFDIGNERAIVLRGQDGVVRAFHNLCRHRGSRVVADDRGTCKHVITCPFHGWSYNLDGKLRGASRPNSLPKLDPVEWGLKSIETETWNGFIFLRFKAGPQGSIKAIMKRFDVELEPYGLDNIISVGGDFIFAEANANWKSMRDVDNEGYHVANAHPSLQDLYGKNYFDEPYENGAARSLGKFNDTPSKLWSVRHYRNLLSKLSYLPEPQNAAWLYIGIFPNTVIGLYPDSVIFYQDIPVGPKQTKQRGAVYKQPNENRLMKAARYLSGRIDGLTADEDIQLTVWTDEAPLSSGFDGILLSDLEYGVASFHNHLRSLIPVLNQTTEPDHIAIT